MSSDEEYEGWWIELCSCGWSSSPKHERSLAAKEGKEHRLKMHIEQPKNKLTFTAPYPLVNWVMNNV